jgi:uncharacterized membrane protein
MSKWLLSIGRAFYAAGLASIGLMHFFFRNFPLVIIPSFPTWLPLRLVCVHVVGAALTAAGIAMLFNLKGRKVAAWTGVALIVLVLIAHIPSQLSGPNMAMLGSWTNTIKELALAGGAWIVALSFPREEATLPASLEKALPLGKYFFAFLLVIFGIDHFLYAKFVAMLVPSWVGAQMFWTYFAGVALISGGLGITVRRVAPLASLLVGVMIFLWVVMLHIPRAIADPYSLVGNEWASVFEATAFSGLAFMLAVMSKKWEEN